MKYPPFDIAIRLVHVVRYVKGQLIKRPLCIIENLSPLKWVPDNICGTIELESPTQNKLDRLDGCSRTTTNHLAQLTWQSNTFLQDQFIPLQVCTALLAEKIANLVNSLQAQGNTLLDFLAGVEETSSRCDWSETFCEALSVEMACQTKAITNISLDLVDFSAALEHKVFTHLREQDVQKLGDCSLNLARKREKNCLLSQQLLTVEGITEDQQKHIVAHKKILESFSSNQTELETSFQNLFLGGLVHNDSAVIGNILNEGNTNKTGGIPQVT
ncbi:hypothetical protein DSO57_1000927 [Entomophthora muscae]|uniref:Uncharacterized protein n=1 Tax=Entomophthora muscae TaxID=34485 RepID=A0ACC2TKG4_9FUNG|nr:hypothetical protein DSO57_1000927 [Entomophthora muscae]